MKTPKTVVEGYFEIPYKGQMRFSVSLEEDEVKFADGDEGYHNYFGFHMTTYQFSEKPERQQHVISIAPEIRKFLEGKETSIVIPVNFVGVIFDKKVEAIGNCKLYRFYK